MAGVGHSVVALLLAVAATCHQGVVVSADPSCTAATGQGQVEGVYFGHAPTCTYKGLPFAQPPVGALRFAAPQPPSAFTKVPFQATEYGAGCMQHCILQQPTLSCPATVSEDCLFLNVFTPQTSAPLRKRPVMVWIHGGNYIIGAGGTDVYHGSILASQGDVVVVTINYRLGLFGGLYTTGGVIEGNFQLQDQIAALAWVQANIAAFGGDPGMVTIFGQSAGGFSVASLLSSPDAWPYFHRAIVESDPLALPTESEADAAILGDLVVQNTGCPATPAGAQLACMRNISEAQLLAVQQKTPFPKKKGLVLHKFMPWTPVVRPGSTLMPYSVKDAALGGHHAKVPVMHGTVTNESVQFIWEASPKPVPRIEYDLFIAEIFGLNDTELILNLYGRPPSDEKKDVRDFISILGTDYIFTCAGYHVLQEGWAKSVPVYSYLYNHLNSYNKFMQHDWYPECDDWICHGSEIPMLFSSEYFVNASLRPVITADEHLLSAQMKTLWTNFAKSGDPNKPNTLPVASGASPLSVPLFTANGARNTVSLATPTTTVIQNYRQHYCDTLDKVGYHIG